MRLQAFALLLMPLTLSASALAQNAGEPLDIALQRAKAEQAAAEKEGQRLDQVAGRARNAAEGLRAEEQAAAQAIDAAEARITVADTEVRLTDAYIAAHRQHLLQEQQPAAALLAGLAVMARRPPLLALADRGSTDELVEVRLLLASTLPAIRARTVQLSAELNEGERLRRAALDARSELSASRQALGQRRARFAELEQRAQQQALAAGGQALNAGDAALAAGEDVERLGDAQANGQSIRSVAQQMAATPAAPPRPFTGGGAAPKPPFAYALPAAAPVIDGLASVSSSGVRSRGVTLATPRGAVVNAPADGTIRFTGPFRNYDGVMVIDHGGGWLSLIVNVSGSLRAGDQVRLGETLGRALGPIEVELSQNGRRISPALIAGSSGPLSNGGKGG